jgi:hypothetical protein
MIALDRLQQIIPADWALANKALSVALTQIAGISNMNLPTLAATTTAMETTRDLPLITALTTAVPPSVSNYYTSTLAVGNGPNGEIRVVDVIGLAGGWVATDAFIRTVAIFSTMNLTYLTLIYRTMANSADGTYGDPELGPLTIPPGLPGAGTYIAITEPNPDPPPTDLVVETALQAAMAVLIPIAETEILNLIATYPTQTEELNTLFDDMANQVVAEQTLQPIVKLNYSTLTANDRNSIYGFIFNLPGYGLQTEVGGMAWFLEAMADLTTQSGQAIVACLREGTNQVALGAAGIYTNSTIPSEPDPPPPDAVLIPSEYTTAEAAALLAR